MITCQHSLAPGHTSRERGLDAEKRPCFLTQKIVWSATWHVVCQVLAWGHVSGKFEIFSAKCTCSVLNSCCLWNVNLLVSNVFPSRRRTCACLRTLVSANYICDPANTLRSPSVSAHCFLLVRAVSVVEGLYSFGLCFCFADQIPEETQVNGKKLSGDNPTDDQMDAQNSVPTGKEEGKKGKGKEAKKGSKKEKKKKEKEKEKDKRNSRTSQGSKRKSGLGYGVSLSVNWERWNCKQIW